MNDDDEMEALQHERRMRIRELLWSRDWMNTEMMNSRLTPNQRAEGERVIQAYSDELAELHSVRR